MDGQLLSAALANRIEGAITDHGALAAVIAAAQADNAALRVQLQATQRQNLELQLELDRLVGGSAPAMGWGADETLVWFGRTFSFADRYIERFAALVSFMICRTDPYQHHS